MRNFALSPPAAERNRQCLCGSGGLPRFTIGSFPGNVNPFLEVSTGFFGFLWVLCCFGHVDGFQLPVFTRKFRDAVWRTIRGPVVVICWFPVVASGSPSKQRGLAAGGERFVEEVDDGCGEAEAVDDGLDEGGPGDLFGGQGGGDAPLAAEDEIDGGVVGEEAFGGPGEGLAVDGLEEAFEARLSEEAAELDVAGGAGSGEVAADGEELLALGHVDACGDGDGGGADVEVEATARGLFESGAGPPGGGVDLVGALVRGEADVAVDAHQDFLGWADVVGREAEHGGVDLGDDGEHGCFELVLEDVTAGFEPGAVVVALEPREELEGGRVEVGGHLGMVAGGCGPEEFGARK